MSCSNNTRQHRSFSFFHVMHPFHVKIVSLIVKAYSIPLKKVWRTFGRIISSVYISKRSPEVSGLGIKSVRQERTRESGIEN